jgi:hypothetical protein
MALSYIRVLAAMYELERLAEELYLPYASRADLTSIVSGLLRSRLRSFSLIDFISSRRKVDVSSVDERPDHLYEAVAELDQPATGRAYQRGPPRARP